MIRKSEFFAKMQNALRDVAKINVRILAFTVQAMSFKVIVMARRSFIWPLFVELGLIYRVRCGLNLGQTLSDG